MTASYKDPRWDCSHLADGFRCSMDGVAVCSYQEHVRAPACECER